MVTEMPRRGAFYESFLCPCHLRMVECLHMYSQNCRGLNSFEKRREKYKKNQEPERLF